MTKKKPKPDMKRVWPEVMNLVRPRAWLLLGSDGARAFGEGTLRFYASKGLLVQVSVHSSQGRNTLL